MILYTRLIFLVECAHPHQALGLLSGNESSWLHSTSSPASSSCQQKGCAGCCCLCCKLCREWMLEIRQRQEFNPKGGCASPLFLLWRLGVTSQSELGRRCPVMVTAAATTYTSMLFPSGHFLNCRNVYFQQKGRRCKWFQLFVTAFHCKARCLQAEPWGSHLGAVTQGFVHTVLASVRKVKSDLMDGSASLSGEQLERKA